MTDNKQDDAVGWDDAVSPGDDSLNALPKDWNGYTRAAKVQKLVDVIQQQIVRVRTGNFDLSKCSQVAALALEGQIELAEFYADAESTAKSAKYETDYIEGAMADDYKAKAVDSGTKITEASIKRMASYAPEVKDAKKAFVKLEKESKKWRYVYEILKEAHVFFRNLNKA